MSKRRNHDTAFKARVALEALKGERTVSGLATSYEAHPTMILQWKKAQLEGATGIFERDSKAATTAEVAEDLRVGHRRVGRLMRQNAIFVVRTRKFKATTDSHHTFNIAPNLLQQDFAASQPNQKCPLMVCKQTISG